MILFAFLFVLEFVFKIWRLAYEFSYGSTSQVSMHVRIQYYQFSLASQFPGIFNKFYFKTNCFVIVVKFQIQLSPRLEFLMR